MGNVLKQCHMGRLASFWPANRVRRRELFCSASVTERFHASVFNRRRLDCRRLVALRSGRSRCSDYCPGRSACAHGM